MFQKLAGLAYLLVIVYVIWNTTPAWIHGSTEWFNMSITTVIAQLLAWILISIGDIISRMDK